MACKYTMLRTTPDTLTFSWLIIFFMLHIPTLVQICYSLAPDQCTTHTHDSNKDLHNSFRPIDICIMDHQWYKGFR